MAEPERSSLNRKGGVGGALPLLGVLQRKGCVVIADAPHCHSDIAKAIVARQPPDRPRSVPISPLKKVRMSGSTSPTVNSFLFQFVKH